MKLSGRPWAAGRRIDRRTTRALDFIASYYDACKVGYQGNEGYRKSTDLRKFAHCIRDLFAQGFLHPHRTVFTDLGCADGRVNVMMSYFVRNSIGIEIDPDILAEYEPNRQGLLAGLQTAGLDPPKQNVHLFSGSSLGASVYRRIFLETGIRFGDMDLFYTYITLHEVFAEKIAREAADGALYLVYGFYRVLPAYPGLKLLLPDVGGRQIAALFAKERDGC